jgi:LemA protein
MSEHLLWWSVCAVLLFWSVGAYNRMVRLRSEALRAFMALGLLLQRLVEPVVIAGTNLALDPTGTRLPSWSGVRGAADQFTASLAVARIKPLDAEAMAALSAAGAVLRMAWQRSSDENAALPEAVLPEGLNAKWDEINRQTEAAVHEFGIAVGSYNAAIAQFPAALLAWLFGFRKAQALSLPRI